MKYEQSYCHQFSFKLCIKASIICLALLMALHIYAEEKPADIKAAADAAAAIAAVGSLFPLNNKTDKPEVIVEEIPAALKAAVEKKLLSKLEIKKSEMDDEALQVFSAPIYNVKPSLGYISVVDGEVLDLNNTGSEAILTGYLKLIRDDFVLDSEEKASLLANAFHRSFPYKFKKIVKPVKVTHGWVVPLGKFFKKYSGLVFTTDDKGKITLVEFVLSINPKDYSYEFNKQNRDMGDLFQGMKQLN